MILVDTSAWVEYDRATRSAVDRRLTELISTGGPVAVTEPIIMEVLAGARNDEREADLRRLMLRFDLLQFDVAADFDAAVGIYRDCRGVGITPRGIVDCMIASVARRRRAVLLSHCLLYTSLSDVKVTGNSDSAGGGLSAAGVYNGHNDGPNSASMTITDGSSVDSNLATGEYCTGGILNNGGTLTIENSSVRWNTCTGLEGTGGIGNGNGGTLNISQSSIEINRATDEGYGGGIWNDSTLVITDGVTVSGNYAECYGGGLMDALPPSYVVQAHITGGTFIDNQSEYGGGIFLQAGPIYLTSSIVTVNSSDSQGGAGIYENAGDGTSLTSTSSWVLLNIPDNIFTGGIAYPNPAECNP